MSTWLKNELSKIAESDDLHIAPLRKNGMVYGPPSWIWSMAVDGALYVRPYNGTKSSWHQTAIRQKAGRIIAAGMTKDVTFEAVRRSTSGSMKRIARNNRASPYLNPMIGPDTQAATVNVIPRATRRTT
jgi:hypothetical protein